MSVNKFRRFTYFFPSEEGTISHDILKSTSEYIQNELRNAGLLSYEIYKETDDYFLLIDASTEMNSTSINQVFSTLNITFKASPLERIYKLDQKKIFTPQEGQLKTPVGPYKRFVWTLLLEPDLIEEYKQAHAIGKAWPEITANMKSIGVKDMEIYLHNAQAILIMDTEPDFDLEEIVPKWQKLPREEEWQTYVAKFQRTDPKSSIQEKWQDMKPLN